LCTVTAMINRAFA